MRASTEEVYVIEAGGKSADEREKKLTVETTDNHVYFYATVDSDRCLAMIKSIRELDRELRNEHASRDLPEGWPMTPIWLHINSYGGYVTDGLGSADQLKRIKSPIYSVIEGCCASAATLISLSCSKRFIMPSAYMLIHQLSSFTWGTYEQIKDDVHLQDMMMKRLVAFYAKHSKMKPKDVKARLKHDSWFNAQQCIKLGLADEIL